MTGYYHGPAADAVLAAVGGLRNLNRPDPRRVLTTARCEQGHLLGRVISTRLGPVWATRPEAARTHAQMDYVKPRGYSLGRGGQTWRFALLDRELGRGRVPHQPRCRCGGGNALTWALDARITLLDAVEAKTRVVYLDRRGLPTQRAR